MRTHLTILRNLDGYYISKSQKTLYFAPIVRNRDLRAALDQVPEGINKVKIIQKCDDWDDLRARRNFYLPLVLNCSDFLWMLDTQFPPQHIPQKYFRYKLRRKGVFDIL